MTRPVLPLMLLLVLRCTPVRCSVGCWPPCDPSHSIALCLPPIPIPVLPRPFVACSTRCCCTCPGATNSSAFDGRTSRGRRCVARCIVLLAACSQECLHPALEAESRISSSEYFTAMRVPSHPFPSLQLLAQAEQREGRHLLLLSPSSSSHSSPSSATSGAAADAARAACTGTALTSPSPSHPAVAPSSGSEDAALVSTAITGGAGSDGAIGGTRWKRCHPSRILAWLIGSSASAAYHGAHRLSQVARRLQGAIADGCYASGIYIYIEPGPAYFYKRMALPASSSSTEEAALQQLHHGGTSTRPSGLRLRLPSLPFLHPRPHRSGYACPHTHIPSAHTDTRSQGVAPNDGDCACEECEECEGTLGTRYPGSSFLSGLSGATIVVSPAAAVLLLVGAAGVGVALGRRWAAASASSGASSPPSAPPLPASGRGSGSGSGWKCKECAAAGDASTSSRWRWCQWPWVHAGAGGTTGAQTGGETTARAASSRAVGSAGHGPTNRSSATGGGSGQGGKKVIVLPGSTAAAAGLPAGKSSTSS